MNVRTLRSLLIALVALAPLAVVPSVTADVVAVKGAKVHTGDGTTIENGVVIIRDGRIVAVGKGVAIPSGATVIDVDGAEITPGLIDANARLEPRDQVSTEPARRQGVALADLLACGHDGEHACTCSGMTICSLSSVHDAIDEDPDSEMVCPICGYPAPPGFHDLVSGVNAGNSPTEASAEVVPHTWVVDGVNLRSPDFARLARDGVTTVYASPDNAAVIGPRGAVLRTMGSMKDRVLVEAGAVHAAMGTDTFRVGGGNRPPFRGFVNTRTRRPGSRMGVAWVFRKAMYDAQNSGLGFDIGGADTPPEAALPVLNELREGTIPLRVAARAQRDIEAALRLAEEFDLDFTLTEGIEAHLSLDALVERKVPVVFGPMSMDRSGRGEQETRFTTFRDLLAAGVPTALSAMDRREEDGLARQAMYAMRSGVSFDQALRAVTLTPAEMIGVADDLGSLAVGKRGDLVVWSGAPFAATSRPLVVVMDGATVVDHRTP